MRFLAIEHELPGVLPERMQPLLEEEAAVVWALKKRDVLRDIWFAMPGRRAVLLLECPRESDVRTALDSLPLVRERCIEFEILALQPYDGFERLFQRGKNGSR